MWASGKSPAVPTHYRLDNEDIFARINSKSGKYLPWTQMSVSIRKFFRESQGIWNYLLQEQTA
jgi:hypothetical protein